MAKQKSLKKTIKSNKKKKPSLKTLDFKKNWKKLTYGGVLSLLLFSSISLAGYTYLEQRNLEAKAAGYSYIGYGSGTSVRGCKTNTGYHRIVFSNGSSVRVRGGYSLSYNVVSVPAYSSKGMGLRIWSPVPINVNGRIVGTTSSVTARC